MLKRPNKLFKFDILQSIELVLNFYITRSIGAKNGPKRLNQTVKTFHPPKISKILLLLKC